MANERNPDIGYMTGVLSERNVIAVVAASARLEEQKVAHAFLAIYKENVWKVIDEDFDIISLTVGAGEFSRHLALLGILGEVVINAPGGPFRERVQKGKGGPNSLRTMDEVRAIGAEFFAVGMRRQVYRRRIAQGPWSRDDQGVVLSDASLDIAGFLSVDGFDEDEMYAVGYRGEIWVRDAKRWQQVDSPTNARLECVRCGKDGTVLICGDAGLVLHGRGMQWQIIDANGVDALLTSVAQFKGEWYVACEEGEIFLVSAHGLQRVPGFDELGATSGKLEANASSLLSVGEEDLVLFDGKKWQRLAHPPIDPT